MWMLAIFVRSPHLPSPHLPPPPPHTQPRAHFFDAAAAAHAPTPTPLPPIGAMKLPLTLHPANHLAVQCLLLHAALSSDSVSAATTAYTQHEQYNTAARIARLRTRYNWEKQHGPCHIVRLSHCWKGLLHPPAAAAAAAPATRVGAPSSLVLSSSALETTQNRPLQPAKAHRALAFTAPARLVALHAPPVLLGRLPQCIHDVVSYDAAVHHASLLMKLLAPYGVHVALTGATRRGCPFSFQAEFLLCLSEAATCEVEAVHPDGASGLEASDRGGGHHATSNPSEDASGSGASSGSYAGTATTEPLTRATWGSKVRKERATMQPQRARTSIQCDSLMLRPPPCPSTSSLSPETDVSMGEDGGAGHHRQERIHGRLGRALRRRNCDRRTAFSSADAVSPQVSYRWRRALESLVRCSFVVSADKPFPPSPSHLKARKAIGLTARYDPHFPTQVPPRACTDAAVLQRLQLHRLLLRICPWHAFAARQLFLTGPADFTTHVTLRALEHGVNVNMNGAFLLEGAGAASGQSGVGSTTPASTTRVSIDDQAGSLPPVHHEAQPQRRRELVEQLILQEEELVALAGLPHVDPMLRGLYCQQQHP
ncbi:hypothetical protein, conserved [Leishmania tarentolae]|uniref:Uncharacterized protein n=1 Tax=Leishmania tarentolae TaxID=5689 RepID=A0A640K6W8_LEITA|nr:hypothetical protein, conserved [Leishmania tarentolae]